MDGWRDGDDDVMFVGYSTLGLLKGDMIFYFVSIVSFLYSSLSLMFKVITFILLLTHFFLIAETFLGNTRCLTE